MFLKIPHWNCDGISTKVEELTAVARRGGIHVILLNELRITARFKLRIRGYVPYVLRNNNAHGGVAALIREDVPHRRVELRDDKDPNLTVGSRGPGVFGQRVRLPDYSRANWQSFRAILNEVPIVSDIPDIEALDSLITAVGAAIRKAADKTIPIKTLDPFRYSELPIDVRNLIRSRNRIRNPPETDPATEELVEESLRSFYLKNPILPETALEFLTSLGCIRKHISKSSSLKAPGNDSIQNHVLKHILRKTLAQITYIFNAAFKLQHFPSPWKTAIVIPVPKPGKEPRLATSYRPISLLPAISKIFEKILLRYVDKYTNDNSVLPPEQFGFRRKHSTNHQVARVVTDVISAFNKRQYTVLMVVVMEKAFDRVWVEGLIHKIILNGYPPPIVRILHSYLRGRQFAVKVNCELSDLRPSTAGVPQGSVLGPVLFNLYTSDIPKFPNNSIATYAYDTAL
ncbi:hypothetical protein Trydic_g14166 [Trypoxylus dichotomus]